MKTEDEVSQAFKDMLNIGLTHDLSDVVHAAQHRGAVVALGWVLGLKEAGCEKIFEQELLQIRATLATHQASVELGL